MPYWKLYYHFIWGTKHRLPIIDAGFETELYRVIVAKAKELGSFVHAIGGTEADSRVESTC
jgi:putative transposase